MASLIHLAFLLRSLSISFAPSQSMMQLFLSAWSVIADLCSTVADSLFSSLVYRLIVMFSTFVLCSSNLVSRVVTAITWDLVYTVCLFRFVLWRENSLQFQPFHEEVYNYKLSGLWIFGVQYILGTLSAVGYTYVYCSSVILSSSFTFLIMDTNCLLYCYVGSFFSFSYVLSFDNMVVHDFLFILVGVHNHCCFSLSAG